MMLASQPFADIMAFKNYGQPIETSVDSPPFLLATPCSNDPEPAERQALGQELVGAGSHHYSFQNVWLVRFLTPFLKTLGKYSSLAPIKEPLPIKENLLVASGQACAFRRQIRVGEKPHRH